MGVISHVTKRTTLGICSLGNFGIWVFCCPYFLQSEAMGCETMKIDGEKQANKRRKLPDGINQGVELLQSGLKFIGNGLSQWNHSQFDSTELHNKFLAHFSHLEDVIAHMVELAGTS